MEKQSINKLFENFSINDRKCFMNDLFNNYKLVINENEYRFSELELYYYSAEHPDKASYPRDNKNPSEIYFHRSGIDICFLSNENEYGGVLIRSIKDKFDNYIVGPLTCCHAILNENKPNINIEIIYEYKETEMDTPTRRVVGKKNKKMFSNELYRFTSKDFDKIIMSSYKSYYNRIKDRIKTEEVAEDLSK